MKFSRLSVSPSLIAKLLACAFLSALAAPSFAVVTFDFAKLGTRSGDFRPNETANRGYWGCTNGDNCSANFDHGQSGGDLRYRAGGLNVSATSFVGSQGHWSRATTVQDHDSNYNAARQIGGGLGVYRDGQDGAVIDANERLELRFDRPVRLESLFMRSELHNGSWNPASTFLLNGQAINLASKITNMDFVGKTFVFDFGGANPDQYFLGGMQVHEVCQVPEPETYAMMLGGLGALLMLQRRRKAAKQAAK